MLASALSVLLASCAPAACEADAWNADNAPEAYRGPATTQVTFASPEDVVAQCKKGLPPVPEDITVVACTWRADGHMVVPNPCLYAATEFYARIMCHEKGHVLGWKHD